DGDEAAHALLAELYQRMPSAAADAALEQRRLDWEVEELAARLQGAGAEPLNDAQRGEIDAARTALSAADLDGATERLHALRDEAPRSPEVWAVLSDLREAQDDVEGAEAAIRTAERLAPLDPDHPARLGDLLATWYGGRLDVDAAEAYGRALRRNPAWAEVWARKARLEHRARRLPFAESAWTRYLQLAPAGPHAAEARRSLDGRARAPAAALALPPLEPSPVSDEASRAYYL